MYTVLISVAPRREYIFHVVAADGETAVARALQLMGSTFRESGDIQSIKVE